MRKKITMLLAALFLVMGSAWAQTSSYTRIESFEAARTNSTVYALKATRSPLYFNTDHNELAGKWTSSSQVLQGDLADATSTEQQFAFLRTEKTEAGKYYMYSVVGQCFITAKGKKTETPEPVVWFKDVTDKDDADHPGMKLYVGTTGDNVVNMTWWSNNTAGGVRYNTNSEADAGNVFELIAYDQTVDLATAVAAITTLENSAVNVTYKYVYGTTTWKTEKNIEVTPGQAFPVATAAPYGVTYTFPNGNVVPEDLAEGAEVIVTCNSTIAYATDFASIEHWYYMDLKDGKYLYYEEGQEYIPLTKTAVDANNRSAYAWAFVGNPFDGFKIVNKLAGSGKILSSSTNTSDGNTGANTYPILTSTPVSEGKNELWVATASTYRNNVGFYLEQKGHSSNKMNSRDSKLAYWNGGADAGSTFVISEIGGVFDLGDLKNANAYALQAERAPLLYIDEEGKRTKLGSSYNTSIATAPQNANQQFLILRTENTPAGSYYLYSIGAQKFVGADLVFTDYPSPVLSFEAYSNAAHNTNYPWWVKIEGKYLIPGGGTAGHNLHHVTGGDDDEGKRFRILSVGNYDASVALEKIRFTENTVASSADFSNDKVYTVTPADKDRTGVWDVKRNDNGEATMLAITAFTENTATSADVDQQFAFLTANGEYYLYSYGAKKFVAKDGNGQKLTDELSDKCLVEFLNSTITANQRFYPLVVKVGGSQLHSSYQSHLSGQGGIITNWNHTESNGNALAIVPVGGTVDLSDAVAKITTYQLQREKATLNALIGEARTLVGKDYIGAAGKATLNTAITAAQDIYDTATDLNVVKAQIISLTTTINSVAYVVDPTEFSNNAIYTFLSNRNATAYMMYDGTNNFVASKFKQTGLEAGDDKVNCHWAVYKSETGKYYMYNLGAQKFMGTETAANANIPFSATPQTTELKFKTSVVAGHPIMISSNGGAGAVNHSNNGFDGKNVTGIVNWAGGFGETDDPGNAHKVAIVGELEGSTLATIAELVNTYERNKAIEDLRTTVGMAMSCLAAMGDRLGQYSSSMANPAVEIEEINSFKTGVVNGTLAATTAEIMAKTARLNEIIATFTINPPKAGLFYRFYYDFESNGGVKYMQATASNAEDKQNALLLSDDDEGSASIFFYGADKKLLSFSAGLYVDEKTSRGLQTVGATGGTVEFHAGEGYNQYAVKVGNYLHANIHNGIYFVDHCDSNPKGHSRHGFYIEEVVTLPVTVSAVGYATLYAPVALEIPAGVTAYVGVKVDNYLDLTDIKEVTGGNVIPANTGVILEAKQGTYNFAIVDDVAALDKSKNLLTGKYPKSEKNANANVYTLQNGTNGVGLYLFKGQNAQGATTYINGFRAWVELPNGSNATALRIRKAGTTEIEEPIANGQQPTAIYDLAGRRVEKMEKGIYIVNGKKVVIK